MSVQPDAEAIHQTLAVLAEPAGVVELRIPHAGRDGTVSGYYDDLDKLAADVARLNRQYTAPVYVTLNAVNPALLARANNRFQTRAASTTADNDILRRRWLLVDLDAKRPAGISATDAEHDA